jgi:hypothetical protein
MRRSTSIVIFALLALSLALNVVLLRRRAVATISTTATTAVCPAVAAEPGAVARIAWPSLQRAARPSAEPTTPRPSAAGPVDDEVQQSALCTLAENKIADEWRKQGPAITESLRRSLNDRDEQERNVKQNASELEDLLQLPEASRAAFTEQYRERRLARVDEAARAIAQTPPDYTAVTRSIAGLFTDEDALALKFAGEAGRDQLRADALEGRTTFLAVATALAGTSLERVRW